MCFETLALNCSLLILCIIGGCALDDTREDAAWPRLAQSENRYFRVTVQPRSDGVSVGLNHYELSVFDADDVPIERADIRLELWMPDHGHGSDREPSIDWREGASYIVDNVVYTMPGLWTWTLFIESEQYTDSIKWGVDSR